MESLRIYLCVDIVDIAVMIKVHDMNFIYLHIIKSQERAIFMRLLMKNVLLCDILLPSGFY